jgi:uncharacterized membrane protein YcaP (DUF421 family)
MELIKFHINNIINIYMSVINNDYQTNLLFKQFTGVAATQLDQQFSNEPYRAIKNIFSRDIFIEEVPLEAPISIYNLDNSGAWIDSSGALPSVNSSNTFSQVYPDSKLEFYKNIELTAVPGSNSRVWYKLDASNNNILQDTINFKFDDINSTYLMRTKYNNGAVYVNNPINSYPLFWVLDNQSGYLQFYSTTAQLSANANIPTNPPRISFFKYVGKKGLLNLDISGQQQVVDISGLDVDISNIQINLNNLNRMILPDGYVDISGGSPWDLCGNEVVRTYYQYTRGNTFIGHNNLPILNGNSVNHAGDPSHNGIIYELDVSGNTYLDGKLSSGIETIIDTDGSTALGHYNDISQNVILVVGCGTPANRKDAFYIDISCVTHVNEKLEVSGNLIVLGHTQLQDVSTNNLEVSGNLIVLGNTQLQDVSTNNLDVSGNLIVLGHTQLQDVSTNNLEVSGNLIVLGDTQLQDVSMNNLDVSGNLIVLGHTQLQDVSTNNLDVSGNLIVLGHTQLQDVSTNNLDVSGNLIVLGHTQLQDVSTNNLDVSGNLIVLGHTQLGDVSMNNLEVSGNLIILGNTQLGDVSMNNLEVSGNLIVLGDTQLQDVSTNNLEVSGNLIVLGDTQLQDVSTNNLEVSGNIILWNDMSMNGGQITFIGNATDPSGVPSWGQVQAAIDASGGGTSDLNKYFIDIPVAPTDGSGSSVPGVSSIVLLWTNPIQSRAAFDFYQNITALYPGIVDPLASDLQNRMNYVPFHRNLKLQFRAVDPSAADPPPADWPNLQSGTAYPWTDVSNADISGSSINGVLFKDIDYATFSITGGSGVYIQDLSTNKYSNEDGVPTGKIFQFRVAQTNLGYVNGNIPLDNSWNYLYIPDISNEYIQIGEFGPPEPPSALNFFNMTYERADISGMTLNDADASLNTPFPISYPPSSISVKYQFDLSSSPFNSVQYPTNLNAGQFDVSFVTINTQQNNFTIDLSYNQTQGVSGTWYGTGGTVPITQLDVYPEHKYELDGSFCMYNIINGVVEFDPSCIPITDISFVSVRPTRTVANETGQSNSEKYFEDQINQLLFTNASTTYTVIDSTGTTQNNVYFIDNTESLPFTLSGNYYTQDNSDNILGIDASGIPCSKYVFDCSNSALVSDASVNTLGFNSIKLPTPIGDFVDTSNNDFRITIFNNDIGTGQKKGGYYSYAQIIPDASTNFVVSQSRYTDSSNNNYDPYDINIKQYYNTQSLGSENWIPSGEKIFQFLLGWDPSATTFAFNSLTVTNPSTSQDFFGLKRPANDANVAISFDISNRNLSWRGSTLNYTTMSTTDLLWNKQSSYINFDTETQTWLSIANWLDSQSITETLTISRINDLGSSIPNTNSYCRKGVNAINNPVNQFKIGLTYANNVPLPSPQTQYVDSGTQPPTDISFNNKLLFWDFTWKGNTSWVSSATLSGTGLDSTGGFYPDNPSSGNTQFFSSYDHLITLPNNQLMWAGEDSTTSTLGAFRNGNHGSNNENPYIDYSGIYFDNSYNYSTQDNSGVTVNISYSKNGSPGDYYADVIGAPTVSEINGVYKWITVKITKSITDSNIINISVDDDILSTMTLGDDYILFICEASAQFTVANSPYVGRTGWKDTARKYDTQLGNITQNTNGAGIYINNGNGNLQLFTSNNVSADLYLRIGLANRNSTTNVNIAQTTTQKAIGRLSWSFI